MLRSQEIAVATLQQIEEAAQQNAEFQQRYSTLVNRLPIMVRENGLVATFGFLEGKGQGNLRSPESILLRQLGQQLDAGERGLHALAREVDLRGYRHLTRRVMELLVWYKRLAESKLDADGGYTHAD